MGGGFIKVKFFDIIGNDIRAFQKFLESEMNIIYIGLSPAHVNKAYDRIYVIYETPHIGVSSSVGEKTCIHGPCTDCSLDNRRLCEDEMNIYNR